MRLNRITILFLTLIFVVACESNREQKETSNVKKQEKDTLKRDKEVSNSIAENIDLVGYHYDLANIHLNYKMYSKAEDELRVAKELCEKRKKDKQISCLQQIYQLYARLYVEKKDMLHAADNYRRLFKMTATPDSKINFGMSLLRTLIEIGSEKEAEKIALSILQMKEVQPWQIQNVSKMLVQYWKEKGLLDKKLKEYEARKDLPEKSRLVLLAAGYENKKDGLEKAARYYKALIEAGMKNQYFYNSYVSLLASLGKKKQALSTLLEMRKLFKEQSGFLDHRIAMLVMELEGKEKAISYIKEIVKELKKNGANIGNLSVYAGILSQLQDVDSATELLRYIFNNEKGKEMKFNYGYQIANTYAMAGRIKDAKEWYRRLEKLATSEFQKKMLNDGLKQLELIKNNKK